MSRFVKKLAQRIARCKRLQAAPFTVEFDEHRIWTYQVDPDDATVRRFERDIRWDVVQHIRGVNADLFAVDRHELWFEGEDASDFLLVHEDMQGWFTVTTALPSRFTGLREDWEQVVWTPFKPPYEVSVWSLDANQQGE